MNVDKSIISVEKAARTFELAGETVSVLKSIDLNVEPGEYRPETVLFNKGFKGFFWISFHLFISIPYKNKFGSKDGEEFIATISPV